MTLPRVLVLALGGTIASAPGPGGGGAVPRLSPAELLAAVPAAATIAEISVETFRQYPSGDLSIDDVVELAALIRERSAEADGFVITQGTDTLEETSYLLDLLLGDPLEDGGGCPPVVLTGAMRNAALPGADGPANILSAVRVAISPEAAGLGPLVVFADEIHLPRFVRKVHSSSIGAFVSPGTGPLGWVTEDRVRIPLVPRDPTPTVRLTRAGDLPTVGIMKIGLGSGPILAEHVTGMDGLVVEAFGGGHVPGAIVESVARINARIPVVMVTRTGGGEVYESTYSFPGSEQDLLERGIISGHWLDGAKARVLLILLLASGADRAVIRARFAEAP